MPDDTDTEQVCSTEVGWCHQPTDMSRRSQTRRQLSVRVAATRLRAARIRASTGRNRPVPKCRSPPRFVDDSGPTHPLSSPAMVVPRRLGDESRVELRGWPSNLALSGLLAMLPPARERPSHAEPGRQTSCEPDVYDRAGTQRRPDPTISRSDPTDQRADRAQLGHRWFQTVDRCDAPTLKLVGVLRVTTVRDE